MKIQIISNIDLYYEIKAENKEKALEILHSGKVKPIKQEVIEDKII